MTSEGAWQSQRPLSRPTFSDWLRQFWRNRVISTKMCSDACSYVLILGWDYFDRYLLKVLMQPDIISNGSILIWTSSFLLCCCLFSLLFAGIRRRRRRMYRGRMVSVDTYDSYSERDQAERVARDELITANLNVCWTMAPGKVPSLLRNHSAC